jgi:hypothetical protein
MRRGSLGKIVLLDWYKKINQYEIANTMAISYYRKKELFIAIPSIILSTLSGSLAFASSRNEDWVLSYLMGILNITTSIIIGLKEYIA